MLVACHAFTCLCMFGAQETRPKDKRVCSVLAYVVGIATRSVVYDKM